ncbi:EAL domain-containing protein [Endozoicomonas sp. G2_1]|uniref:putative bifunctional diguanylate cyclase/phosphodiesterase n=1 Tax=Endozoicomonas sp. G2_1 TaxID=2821091 RepID=UPI001ADB06DE|nr:EAL domain-containing protein [Endozoicomonas sp. G2_1]MBO9490647.1 EAL domain-containing protein [Endozoicomonas sp. G2_1]
MSRSNKQLSAEQLLRIVLDTIPLRVFWKDTDLNYLGANQKLIDDIGFDRIEDLIGQSDYAIYSSPEEADPKRADDRKVITSGEAKLNIEEPLPIAGKKDKWLRTNKVPMRTPAGEIIGILGTYQDITAEVEYRQLIEHQALIDPLTKLANRRCLQNQIRDLDYQVAGLLFIDLDRFKQINDTLGHAIGDKLLQKVAGHFQTVADNHGALLARLGGDEFSIFLTQDNETDIKQQLADIAESALTIVDMPIEIEQHIVTVGASIGITTIESKTRSTTDSFTEADLAMYKAKVNGGNRYSFFEDSLKTSAQRKHTLYTQLHNAIDNQEFYLVYQPQFNADQELIGAEALARWRNSELGEVSPAEFIQIAEESGMIDKIGQWVIKQALEDAKQWHSLLHVSSNFKLAINVSSKQFYNKHLVDYVKQQLNDQSFDAQHLEIEITESLLLEQKQDALTAINELKNLGISIAIDDFGTGYSSLSYLAVLPLDKLKVDRAFVTDLANNETNKKLVEAMVGLAASLKLNIIAEGVETMTEIDALKTLNCFEYQGYYFDKPLSYSAFSDKYNNKR